MLLWRHFDGGFVQPSWGVRPIRVKRRTGHRHRLLWSKLVDLGDQLEVHHPRRLINLSSHQLLSTFPAAALSRALYHHCNESNGDHQLIRPYEHLETIWLFHHQS